MIKDLIIRNRSYRRFIEKESIPWSHLLEMVNNARLSPSARNAQSLKYYISSDATENKKIFPYLAWAGYLKDWSGPEEGERPSAYIVQMNDENISTNYFCDDGIAAQSILLTAVEKGYGGCIIGSVKKEALTEMLGIPSHLKVIQVIALGKPVEKVVLEEMKDNDYKYWRDEDKVHHVPKRILPDLIINFES